MIQTTYEKQCNTKETSGCYIPTRQMHTMQAINLTDERGEITRKSWFSAQLPNEGIYLFGGQDRNGQLLNDLWFILPYYKYNQKLLTKNTYEYASHMPTLCVTFKELTEFQGRPPTPRINASSCVIMNSKKEHIIVVYGGRNDEVFNSIKNVALNDINLFNTSTITWM